MVEHERWATIALARARRRCRDALHGVDRVDALVVVDVWRVGTAVERLMSESDEAVRRNRISLGPNKLLLHLGPEGVPREAPRPLLQPGGIWLPPMVEDAQTMACASTRPCRVAPVQGGYEVTVAETMEPGAVLVMQIDHPSFKDADRRAGLDVYSIAWALEFQP